MADGRGTPLPYQLLLTHLLEYSRQLASALLPTMIVQLAALLLGWQPVAVPLSHRRAAVTACAPQPAEAAEAGNWFVAVPRSLDAIAEQAGRSVLGAIRSRQRRVWVEVAAPEFDPSSPLFRQLRLSTLVTQMALPLLGRRDVLPASRPQVKVLYNTVDEATIASGFSFVADLPVSVLSSSLAMLKLARVMMVSLSPPGE